MSACLKACLNFCSCFLFQPLLFQIQLAPVQPQKTNYENQIKIKTKTKKKFVYPSTNLLAIRDSKESDKENEINRYQEYLKERTAEQKHEQPTRQEPTRNTYSSTDRDDGMGK